ncbi:GDSL-type esterase/lipase family protein [Spirosoma sp. 48-14]|uniref:GDSL-type esterase/lipase family protein n=1 Tax=Spirosoma sp. 48-14 TaxID=1895854 RepID=UPI0009646B76|nr:GDSL-type esterase/lipase family protein [Spirosoma sp. 48-14]OJW76300.1 MAG: hypothetical protein BGO59_22540 [Spirosoma sp. 48-14]
MPNGTAVGTIAYTTGASGFGQCLNLAATGNVTISGAAIGNTSTGQTVEGRFKTTAFGNPVSIMVGGNGWYVGFNNQGKVQFAWNALTQNYITPSALNDGNWHTFALVWNTSAQVLCFVDGVLLSTAASGTIGPALSDIGTYGNNSIYRFTGQLDEIRWSTVAQYTTNYTPVSTPFANTNTGQASLWHLDGDLTDSNVVSVALSAGTLTRSINNLTSQKITSSAASGGTAPYNYQFQRAADVSGSAGTYSNIGSNTSTANITDTGLTNNTKYWYRCLVTDNVGVTATSTAIQVTTKNPNAYYLGFIGNSITQGYQLSSGQEPPTALKRMLSSWAGTYREVVIVNAAIFGSTSSQWVPGQANYTNALAAFQAAGVDDVFIMLATNDAPNSISLSTSTSNMTSIVNGLVGSGYKVFLNYDPYPNDGRSTTNQNLIVSFDAMLDTLCNGTTVIQGDKGAYTIFQQNVQAYSNGTANSYYQGDGLHPNGFGAEILANLWFYPWARFRNIIQAGITGGIAY